LRAAAAEDEGSAKPDAHTLPMINAFGQMQTPDTLKAWAIRFALLYYQGHMPAMQRRLGISR
jgi:hypothetical protein